MTTEKQDTDITPGEREVDYEDITAGMRFLCAGHSHEILSVESYGPTKESGGRSFRARKVLRLSCVYGCPRKEWTCQPGDAVICAAEPNTDAVDTQPIAVPSKGIFSGAREYERRAAAKAIAPIATHRIPARDVVPGMQWADTIGRMITEEPRPGENWETITAVERLRGGRLNIKSGITGGCAKPNDRVYIRLPGPSPRQLCCSCKDRDIVIYQGERDDTATLDPALHAAGCPVAPVTGVHGGMRLWPAPVGRVTWAWSGAVFDALYDGRPHWPDGAQRCVLRSDIDGRAEQAVWWRDIVLQAFFLPPIAALEPDRRMPGASPDDPDLERVADLVSGGVIGPVRR